MEKEPIFKPGGLKKLLIFLGFMGLLVWYHHKPYAPDDPLCLNGNPDCKMSLTKAQIQDLQVLLHD